jgi:hypothetical protein
MQRNADALQQFGLNQIAGGSLIFSQFEIRYYITIFFSLLFSFLLASYLVLPLSKLIDTDPWTFSQSHIRQHKLGLRYWPMWGFRRLADIG